MKRRFRLSSALCHVVPERHTLCPTWYHWLLHSERAGVDAIRPSSKHYLRDNRMIMTNLGTTEAGHICTTSTMPFCLLLPGQLVRANRLYCKLVHSRFLFIIQDISLRSNDRTELICLRDTNFTLNISLFSVSVETHVYSRMPFKRQTEISSHFYDNPITMFIQKFSHTKKIYMKNA